MQIAKGVLLISGMTLRTHNQDQHLILLQIVTVLFSTNSSYTALSQMRRYTYS